MISIEISFEEGDNMADQFWLVADYFDDFRCKCGRCRHTCCGGWRIAIGEEEYFRMIGMDCSEKLHAKLEAAFVRPEFATPTRYMLLESDWTGRCRMLDEDGMCMLQKECGEGAISEVCRLYPRSYKSENGIYNACCSGSCEAVVELLMRREPLTFRRERLQQMSACKAVSPEIYETVDYDINAIFEEVISILQDRSRSLQERIAIISEKSGIDSGHEGIRASMEKWGCYETLLKVLEEFSEEAPSAASYVNEFERRYSEERFFEQFDIDKKAFEEHFPDWSCYFENMICNNMLYASFPAVDSRVDPHKAVLGLSLEYTLLRVMCICHTAEADWTVEALVDVIAEVYHVVEHTAFYYNSVVLLNGK